MRLRSLVLFEFLWIASKVNTSLAEWTGFLDAELGKNVNEISDLKPQSRLGSVQIFARDADRGSMDQLGLSKVLYETKDGTLEAIEMATLSAEATMSFNKAIVSSWGEPISRSKDSRAVTWLGKINKLTMRIATDGTAIIRLEPRRTVTVVRQAPAAVVEENRLPDLPPQQEDPAETSPLHRAEGFLDYMQRNFGIEGMETAWYGSIEDALTDGNELIVKTNLVWGDSRIEEVCAGTSGYVFSNRNMTAIRKFRVLGMVGELLCRRGN